MKYTKLVTQLEKQRKIISRDRDTLRDILTEFNQLADDCDEAMAHLDEAIDALSRLA